MKFAFDLHRQFACGCNDQTQWRIRASKSRIIGQQVWRNCNAKPTVLPDPVCAETNRSELSSSGFDTSCCTGVKTSYPRLSSAIFRRFSILSQFLFRGICSPMEPYPWSAASYQNGTLWGAVTEFISLVQSRTQRLSNPPNSIIEIRATWRIVKFSGATL